MGRSSFFSDFFLGHQNFASTFTPSPFVDLAGSRAPSNLKRLFPLLEWYAKMDDTVSPVLHKAAEYPIMPLDYSGIEEDKIRKYNKEIFEDCLDTRNHMIEQNVDYFAYGNAFTSIAFPFKRWFRCRKCRHKVYADNVSSYQFKQYQFYFKCPSCGDKNRPKDFGDQYIKDKKRIRYLKWRPHDMDLIRHPYSGSFQYLYTPDTQTKKQINTGSKFILDETPKIILEALRERKQVVFKEGDLFHMRRPSISSREETYGWGVPLLMPCILPGYLKKVFHKASEVSGVLRSSPLHILYPETNAAGGEMGNVLMSGSVSDFQNHMKKELVKHRRDPGYIMTTPHPIGQQTIFGDAKNLHYFQEMKYQDEQLLNALGFPREFLTGGLQFSASSISLRILEVQLMKVHFYNNAFIRWAHGKIGNVFAVGDVHPEMQAFKMADDLQMLQLQLAESDKGNLSKSRVLEAAFGIEWSDEQKRIEKEEEVKIPVLKKRARMDVEVNMESQRAMMEEQAKAQPHAQLATFKEQAQLEKQDPEYSKMMRMQQMQQQQQMMQQQQGMMQQAQQNQAQNMNLKQQQQDRLSIKDGITPSPNESPESQVSKGVGELNKIVAMIKQNNADARPILDKVVERAPHIYVDVVRSIFSQAKDLEENVVKSVFAHASQHAPELIQEVSG